MWAGESAGDSVERKDSNSQKSMEYGLLTLQYNGIDIPGVGKQEKKFMVAQQQ